MNNMMKKFSLYGFLKNLDFSEPFIILFYLSLDLSYFQIGILVGFLNICINIMEIPSGAFADLYGRKNAMVIALASYIVSFCVFSVSNSYAPLFFAVFFYSIGDAFRSGTHKAMIFDWLKINNRLEEKKMVYGFTRSWSNYGSALSVIISTLIVLFTKDYKLVFILSIIPGIIGIINIISYPEELNKKQNSGFKIKHVLDHTRESLKKTFYNKNIRLLVLQGLGFEGCFDVSKNYLQPILKSQALVLITYITLPERKSIAIVVGCIYFILHIISARSSRSAHKFSNLFKNDQKALLFIIFSSSILAFVSSFGLYFNLFFVSILTYIIFFIIQNLWKPILVSQYDDFAESSEQATILSIAAQTKTIGVALLAPIAGFIADNYGIELSMLLISLLLAVIGLYSRVQQNKII